MRFLLFCLTLFLSIQFQLHATTLQDAYLNSTPGLGYDRLIILQHNQVYSGGLSITDENIGIKGHGAIVDLGGDSIFVSGESQIDLDGCVIINGGSALSTSGTVSGFVTHCTFYNNQIGILFRSSGIIEMYNTIFSNNSRFGFACEKYSGRILHYIDMYQNSGGNYMEWCPG